LCDFLLELSGFDLESDFDSLESLFSDLLPESDALEPSPLSADFDDESLPSDVADGELFFA
jgi:hypothetical protein